MFHITYQGTERVTVDTLPKAKHQVRKKAVRTTGDPDAASRVVFIASDGCVIAHASTEEKGDMTPFAVITESH